ncbi:hypothetical protein JCM12178A_32280 [Salidesulfovibrio brasiliensis]
MESPSLAIIGRPRRLTTAATVIMERVKTLMLFLPLLLMLTPGFAARVSLNMNWIALLAYQKIDSAGKARDKKIPGGSSGEPPGFMLFGVIIFLSDFRKP